MSRQFFDSDIYFHPYALGLSALKAQYYGLPIITLDDHKLQMPEYEYVSSRNGALLKSMQIHDFHDSLSHILTLYEKNPSLKKTIRDMSLIINTPQYHADKVYSAIKPLLASLK